MEFRKRGKDIDENEEVKGKEGLKNVLALLYGQTLGLTQPKALAPAMENLERRKGWLSTTTNIYPLTPRTSVSIATATKDLMWGRILKSKL